MAHPTAEWSQLYDRYYRKFEVYEMLWKGVDLFKLVVAGARFGGPIAMVRDERKILMVSETSMKPVVKITSCSGELISQFPWERSQRLAKLGWTDDDKLVVVLEDGTVLLYTVFGEIVAQFSMGRTVKEQGVQEAHIWGGGLVVLTKDNQLLFVNSFDEPRPRHMGDPQLNEPPTAMTIIEPEFTLSRQVEVLLATASGSILCVDPDGVQDQQITTGPFTRMSVSPNGKILACFTATGSLWVVSTDFTKNLSEFSTESTVPPHQLVWCGTDSVVLYWDRILLMVGPFGDWIKYSYDGPVVLIPEIDGVRIHTNDKCEFLQRVPDSTEAIFKIGSMAPAATLHDAYEHFEKKSPKADELIRMIKSDLGDAVEQCLDGAAQEFSHSLQRSLLRTASFGKCFLEFQEADAFVDVCKTLRVLNALRHFEVGIPLTYGQYTKMGPDALITRLINRRQHLLAFRIAEYLRLKVDSVVVHWACEKVKTDADDITIRDAIVTKLSQVPGASYPEIASTAYRNGKRELAIMLLENEPRAAEQVPLLLSMQQDELALAKAVESGDTDLVYLVILHIKRTRATPDFLRILRTSPSASQLFIAYARERPQDHELLKTFFYQANRAIDSAIVSVIEAESTRDLNERILCLRKAEAVFQESRDHQFHAKVMEEEMKLLQVQHEIENEIGKKCVGLSLSDTVTLCIKSGAVRRSMKLKSDFKIPDRRFWWQKVMALGEVEDWQQLERFAKEKKSPIGYEPFAEVCIQRKAVVEAAKYIARITNALTRSEMYMSIGYHHEAAEAAFQAKDAGMLQSVAAQTPPTNRETTRYIDSLMAQMK